MSKVTSDLRYPSKGTIKNPRYGGKASSPFSKRKGKPNPLISMNFKKAGKD